MAGRIDTGTGKQRAVSSEVVVGNAPVTAKIAEALNRIHVYTGRWPTTITLTPTMRDELFKSEQAAHRLQPSAPTHILVNSVLLAVVTDLRCPVETFYLSDAPFVDSKEGTNWLSMSRHRGGLR